MASELSESDTRTLRLAVKEGLEEITKLESRLYPRNPEAFHLRTCFYAVKSVLDKSKKEEPQIDMNTILIRASRPMQGGEIWKEFLGTLSKPESPKEDDPELSLTVGQMKELFDNLVLAGFAKGEAARIVGVVARG